MPIFTNPWAFLGLLLPAVIGAIYLFRNRSQPRSVSSLLLWTHQRRPSEGGLIFQGPQAPLLLLLEILSVVLIVLAAAQPQALFDRQGIPVIVVLDDSFSMLAGKEVNPRQRAIAALRAELGGLSGLYVRFVRCGADAELLGPAVKTWAEAQDQLSRWRCTSPGAALASGIMFAQTTVKSRGRVILVTDHAPPESFSGKEFEWWAFGEPTANIGFTNAARTSFGTRDRVLLEVSNFSTAPTTVSGRLIGLPGNRLLEAWQLEIDAGDTRQLFFDLPPGIETAQATIPNEDLAIDNLVTLVGPQRPPVRTAVTLADPDFRRIVEQAVLATEKAELVNAAPHLLISDNPVATDFSADRWEFIFYPGPEPKGLIGPFAIDAEHPLAPGLVVDGLVWGVGSGTRLPGAPVILAGNRPLLTVEDEPLGNQRLHADFVPQASTLHRSPAWPILFWNLLEGRQADLPGPIETNLRLGNPLRLTVPVEDTDVEIRLPDGESVRAKALQRRCVLESTQTGLYQVQTSVGSFSIAVNALSREESDMRKASSLKKGSWIGTTYFQQTARDLKWAFLFLALLLLVVHQCLVARRPQGVRL